jgi:SAM-dependent methyltransferase
MKLPGREQFSGLLHDAVMGGSLVKLTLAKPSGSDPTLLNLFVRPVALKSGPRLAVVWRHSTRDVTKNLSSQEALSLLESLIGAEFLDAHLFTPTQSAQLEVEDGKARLRIKSAVRAPSAPAGNDRVKRRAIRADASWLRALGVTGTHGSPIAAMADKFRQIENFAEILGHLISAAPLPEDRRVRVFDMGCGKGYLTFAVCELLGERADIVGVEARGDLVDFCNRTAASEGLASRLSFRQGSIADTDVEEADILLALHACDTATDDALAKAIAAGAALVVVAPCCQKEIRPQLVAPPVLSASLRHGIFEERHAEFVTDALRALLLEWSGYQTRVMEFISTEHTAKNLMITAVKTGERGAPAAAARIKELAAFYGVRRQALATQLGFALR